MYALAVLDVQARVYVDHITELDAQVVSGNLVHLNLAFVDIVRTQANEHCTAVSATVQKQVAKLLTRVAPFLSCVLCKVAR